MPSEMHAMRSQRSSGHMRTGWSARLLPQPFLKRALDRVAQHRGARRVSNERRVDVAIVVNSEQVGARV